MNQARNVTAHAIDGELGDMNLCVSAFGPYSPGGAQNHYHIGEAVEVSLVAAEWFGDTLPPGVVRWLAEIRFQDGNPAEHGVNGVTLEALLAVCFDRLECFQRGPHANAYNAEALKHIERAIEALKDRTRERDSAEVAAPVAHIDAGREKNARDALEKLGVVSGWHQEPLTAQEVGRLRRLMESRIRRYGGRHSDRQMLRLIVQFESAERGNDANYS